MPVLYPDLSQPVRRHVSIDIFEAIDRITVRHRTAIGEGLIEAVAALPERTRPPHDGAPPPVSATPKPPGVAVLLSDGQNNSGIDPLDAAEWARRQQVRGYTVGIGQPLGSTTGFVIGGPLDEATLQIDCTAHRRHVPPRVIGRRTQGHLPHGQPQRRLEGPTC